MTIMDEAIRLLEEDKKAIHACYMRASRNRDTLSLAWISKKKSKINKAIKQLKSIKESNK